ncbi:MAG: glycosyltransferase [Terriglobia bacterium]
MTITVILCTFNRATSLSKALGSVACSELPESVEWEVLVVDNNSSDQTREVIEEYRRRFPCRFRYLFEPQQGLSSARNAGIREARGDVLAFLDDDVMVEAEWLNNLTACLHDGKWAGAGGRILPEETFSPPRWLAMEPPYYMGGALIAHFDFGDKPCDLGCPPHGTNMAYRKEMFEKYGGFRTDLGRCGSNTMSNEDTEFGHRLMRAGERLRYEPAAIVYHPVREDRLKKGYFLAWYFDWGRANMREIGRRPDIWGIPRHYLSALRYGIHLIPARTLAWAFTFNRHLRFYQKCLVWKAAGEMAEIYRHRSASKE